MSSLLVVRSGTTGDVWLDGIDEHRKMFMKIIGSLGIDPDRLF